MPIVEKVVIVLMIVMRGRASGTRLRSQGLTVDLCAVTEQYKPTAPVATLAQWSHKTTKRDRCGHPAKRKTAAPRGFRLAPDDTSKGDSRCLPAARDGNDFLGPIGEEVAFIPLGSNLPAKRVFEEMNSQPVANCVRSFLITLRCEYSRVLRGFSK